MSDATNQSALEAARTRLEAALSGLTQGVASTRDALNVATTLVEEKTALEDRISSLEQENLKLHEQVAAFALKPESQPNDVRIRELEAENAAIAGNYKTLKDKYAELQDRLDADTDIPSVQGANDNAIEVENNRLKQIIAEMEAEKNAIRSELDKTISELEAMLEDA